MYPHQWRCSSAQSRISTVVNDNCQKTYKESVGDWHIKKFNSDFSQGVPYKSVITSQFTFLYFFSLFYSPTFRPCINMDWCDCDCNKPKLRGSKAFVQTSNRPEQATVCTGCLNRSPLRWYQRFTSRLEKTLRLSGARRILSRITESPPWPCGEMRGRSCQEPISTVLITASKGRLL